MDANLLIQIVKEAIESKFENREFDYDKYNFHTELFEPKATFVTLYLYGHLRGCIGSLVASKPLLQDLVDNAKSAAFSDPRFVPLSEDEFLDIDIEVSILTTPQPLDYIDASDLKEKIVPHKHGVILKHSYHQVTFLPSVWEQLSDFEQFFTHLCQKAGMQGNCLDKHPEILTYEALKYKS